MSVFFRQMDVMRMLFGQRLTRICEKGISVVSKFDCEFGIVTVTVHVLQKTFARLLCCCLL